MAMTATTAIAPTAIQEITTLRTLVCLGAVLARLFGRPSLFRFLLLVTAGSFPKKCAIGPLPQMFWPPRRLPTRPRSRELMATITVESDMNTAPRAGESRIPAL